MRAESDWTANVVAPPAFEAPAGAIAVARILQRYDVNQLAGFIEVAIGLLDVVDGDPDLEDDDPAGQCDEDGINTTLGMFGDGPGCSLSDPEEDDDPDEEHDGCEYEEGI